VRLSAAVAASSLVACSQPARVPAADSHIEPAELRAIEGDWNCTEYLEEQGQVSLLTISAHPAVNGFWMEIEWTGRNPDYPIMRGMAREDSLHLFDRGGRYGSLQRIPSADHALEYRWPDGGTVTFERKDAVFLDVTFSNGGTQSCKKMR